MNIEEFQRDFYGDSWIYSVNRDNQYNFDTAKFLIELMSSSKKKGICCDVGIGDGYPIAKMLLESKADVHGVDMSVKLIKKCKNNFPQIFCKIGNAEDLPFENDLFDLTYCINTLWYVKNPMKAISELLRVTRPGGTVFFDIMNQYHEEINKLYKRLIFENTTIIGNGKKILKNIVKRILFPKYGFPDWHFIVDQTPLFPDKISSTLPKETKLFTYNNSYIKIPKDDSTNNRYKNYSRIIFLVKK